MYTIKMKSTAVLNPWCGFHYMLTSLLFYFSDCTSVFSCSHFASIGPSYTTSIKIIKNEVGCRDDTVPKTVDTRRHCEEE